MDFVIGNRLLNFGRTGQSVLLLLRLSTFAFTALSAKLPEKFELFFENHCMDCHDDEITEGGLDFLSLTWQPEDSLQRKHLGKDSRPDKVQGDATPEKK